MGPICPFCESPAASSGISYNAQLESCDLLSTSSRLGAPKFKGRRKRSFFLDLIFQFVDPKGHS